MDFRQRQDLDKYITGNYGEDQFDDVFDTAHSDYVLSHQLGVYDYDPADDGPECEVITRILATHRLVPMFVIGKEIAGYAYFIPDIETATISSYHTYFDTGMIPWNPKRPSKKAIDFLKFMGLNWLIPKKKKK